MNKNLHKARTLDGYRVKRENLALGELYYFPSPFAGQSRYRCTELNERRAVFVLPTGEPKWDSHVIEFDVPDLSDDELALLPSIVRNFADLSISQNPQVSIARKADGLGYVNIMSFTQIHWTLDGLAMYKKRNTTEVSH
ncbi:hypothetical protein [Vibrio cholerae]|uniref:hypothetical protein n=1 Tax=Vibrio cholerae TaxID=666 RepID=UPI000E0C754E|nr:hypothetical protein [Vibrio cholerae]HAS5424172.1 hypothetical protein [Vibrio cholerae]